MCRISNTQYKLEYLHPIILNFQFLKSSLQEGVSSRNFLGFQSSFDNAFIAIISFQYKLLGFIHQACGFLCKPLDLHLKEKVDNVEMNHTTR